MVALIQEELSLKLGRTLKSRQGKFQLHNLRPLSAENTLMEAEKNDIWIPSITFENTATKVSIDLLLLYLLFSEEADGLEGKLGTVENFEVLLEMISE